MFVNRGLSRKEVSSTTGRQAFSAKGQRVSVFGFVGHTVSVTPAVVACKQTEAICTCVTLAVFQ